VKLETEQFVQLCDWQFWSIEIVETRVKSSSERDVVDMDLNELSEDNWNTSLWNAANKGAELNEDAD